LAQRKQFAANYNNRCLKNKKNSHKKTIRFFRRLSLASILSNPKQIEFYLANSLNKFFLVGIFELNFQNGYQIFKIDNSNYNIDVEGKIKYIKIIINENFGGARTYLNQVFLLDNINYHNGRKENKFYFNENYNNNNNNNFNDFNDDFSDNNSLSNKYKDNIKKKKKKLKKYFYQKFQ
jgi:hypothetical protein